MKNLDRKNLNRVGLFVSLMACIFMFFVVTLSRENAWFEDRVIVKALLSSAEGLRPGSVVFYKGIKIGSIINIEMQPSDLVEVKFSMANQYLMFLKTDSKVSIASKGLVGDKVLDIIPGKSDSPQIELSQHLSESVGISTSDILKNGNSMTEKAGVALDQISILLSQLNKDNKLEHTLDNIEKLTKQFEKDGTTAQLTSTLKELELIGKRINQGPGTLHSIIYEDGLYNQTEEILGGAKRNRILRYFIRQALEDNIPARTPTKEKN